MPKRKPRGPANGKPQPSLIPQPHGGALLSGGNGGGGRPSSALREALRERFAQRVPLLCQIADDPEIEPRDRLRAVDILGKYGIGTVRELSVDDVRERLRATVAIVQVALPPHQVSEVLAKLREVWTR